MHCGFDFLKFLATLVVTYLVSILGYFRWLDYYAYVFCSGILSRVMQMILTPSKSPRATNQVELAQRRIEHGVLNEQVMNNRNIQSTNSLNCEDSSSVEDRTLKRTLL